ncbi:MAG TPA: glycosyltransferase [Candidatus Acidoferrum sp.]|nr:glycosyltransferase [Candidatus Acidoferrum sp.]
MSAAQELFHGVMPDERYRVLILTTHVIPYASPNYQALANDPRLEVLVAYCSLQGAESGLDPEFGAQVQWDVPLLDGYKWVHVPNKSLRPRLGHFFGLWNPGLWKLLRGGNFDAVVIYTGYMCASFWLAVLAAKSAGVPVLISTDSTTLQSREVKRWKEWLKPFVLRRVYSFVDLIMAASSAAKKLALQLGVPEERLRIIRCGMSKEAWLASNGKFDRAAVRGNWGVPEDAPVVLYCAKLQPWKKPLDLLEAFAKASLPGAYLVFAGEGPQRTELESRVHSLNISDRVRVLGFVNTSQLPSFYRAADLFVLPSAYDPCPLVVPEAMFSGLPVILSDAVLGRLEMIDVGKSGYLYPSEDTDALAGILKRVLADPQDLPQLKEGVRRQMELWTRQEFLDCWVGAIGAAVQLKRNSGRQLQ